MSESVTGILFFFFFASLIDYLIDEDSSVRVTAQLLGLVYLVQ